MGNTETDVDVLQFSENEFIEKFQNPELTAMDYSVLFEIFVRK